MRIGSTEPGREVLNMQARHLTRWLALASSLLATLGAYAVPLGISIPPPPLPF